MLKGIITAAVLLVQCALFSADYSLAICTMFKNEGRWLREWIEYHRLVGVEHFYLYDNESTDNSREVLQPYVEQGLVDVILWKNIHEHWDPRGGSYDNYQIKAFNDCISRTVGTVSWLAVIDVDEYLVPTGKNLQQILAAAESTTGSLYLNWAVFGTSFVWELPEDKLLTETMVLRAPDYHPWNKMTKCIHRPEAVADCWGAHSAQLNSGYDIKTIPPTEARVNKYWTRDEKHLLQNKFGFPFKFRPRNLRNRVPKERCDQILTIIQDLDRLKDETPIPHLTTLKQVMSQQGVSQEPIKVVGEES